MIVLPDHDHAEAKRKAARLGVSLSRYVADLVARDLEADQPTGDLSPLFGMFSGGGSDIAKNKHAMIGEAIDKQYRDKGL